MKNVIRTNIGSFVNFNKMVKHMEKNNIATVEFTEEELNKQEKKSCSLWEHLKVTQGSDEGGVNNE